MQVSTATLRAESDHALTARFERDAIPFARRVLPPGDEVDPRPDEAEDLLQETAAKAFAGFHGSATAQPRRLAVRFWSTPTSAVTANNSGALCSG